MSPRDEDDRKSREAIERRREREREIEEEEKELRRREDRKRNPNLKGGGVTVGADANESLGARLARLEAQVQQLTQLYRQFVSRALKLPPEEMRTRFERERRELEKLPRGNVADQFRLRAFFESSRVHREQWDKWMKEFESGKR